MKTKILRVLAYWCVAVMLHGGVRTLTEESLYYWAPIAVAVVLTLLEMRQAKRGEGKQEELEHRVRGLEFGWLQAGNDIRLADALATKLFERINERLEVLEGTEGVPKESAEKMSAEIETIKGAYQNVALAFQNHDARLDNLESDTPAAPEVPDRPATKRRRGRR